MPPDDVTIEPFVVRYHQYPGGPAGVAAQRYAESLHGYSKVYQHTAFYLLTGGKLPQRKHDSRLVVPRVVAQRSGSLDQQWVIDATLASAALLSDGGIFLSTAFRVVVSSVFYLAANRQKVPQGIVERLLDDRAEERRQTALDRQRERENVIALVSRADSARPMGTLAESLCPAVRRAVTPLGEDCPVITQFAGSDEESSVTEADAGVIRHDGEEFEETGTYRLAQIEGLNLRSGRCRVRLVDRPSRAIPGWIHDPVLGGHADPYSEALARRLGMVVSARVERRAGQIHRLHIISVIEMGSVDAGRT